MYALIVESKEVRGQSDQIMTDKGTRFLVLEEPEGWVPATSTQYRKGCALSRDAKLFDTIEGAEKFGDEWKGHPWWCQPNGNYKVVEVKPVYAEPRVTYYEEVGTVLK